MLQSKKSDMASVPMKALWAVLIVFRDKTAYRTVEKLKNIQHISSGSSEQMCYYLIAMEFFNIT